MATLSHEKATLGKKCPVIHTVNVLTLILLFGLFSIFSSNIAVARPAPDMSWLGSPMENPFTITNSASPCGNGLFAHSTTVNEQFTDGQIITTFGVDCDGNTFYRENVIYYYCFECWCKIGNGEANFDVEAETNIEIYSMDDISNPKLLYKFNAIPNVPAQFLLPPTDGKDARYLIKYSDPRGDGTHSEQYYVPAK